MIKIILGATFLLLSYNVLTPYSTFLFVEGIVLINLGINKGFTRFGR